MIHFKRLFRHVALLAILASAQPVFAQGPAAQTVAPCAIDDMACLKTRTLDRIEAIVIERPALDERSARYVAHLFEMVRDLHDASERKAVDERITRFTEPFPTISEAFAAFAAEQNLRDTFKPSDLDQALVDKKSPDASTPLRDYIIKGFRALLHQGLDQEAHSIWLRHQPFVQNQTRVIHNEMFRRMLQREPEVLAKYMWGMAPGMGQGRNTLGMMGWEAAQRCGRGDREGGKHIVQAMVAVLDAQASTSPMQRGELVEPVMHCVGIDAARDMVRTLAEQMIGWEALITQQRLDPRRRAAEIHSLRVAMFDIVAKPIAVHLIHLGRATEARAVFGLLPAVTWSTQVTSERAANAETVTTIRGEEPWEDFRSRAVEQIFRTIDLTLLFTAAAESRITLIDGVVNGLSAVVRALTAAAPQMVPAERDLAARGLARLASDMSVLQHNAHNLYRAWEIDRDLLKLNLAREAIGACTLSADQRAGFLQRSASIDPDAEVGVLIRLIKRGAPAAGAGVPTC